MAIGDTYDVTGMGDSFSIDSNAGTVSGFIPSDTNENSLFGMSGADALTASADASGVAGNGNGTDVVPQGDFITRDGTKTDLSFTKNANKITSAKTHQGLSDKQVAALSAGAKGASEFITGFTGLGNTRRATERAYAQQQSNLDEMASDLNEYKNQVNRNLNFDRSNNAFLQRTKKEALNLQIMTRDIQNEQKRRGKLQESVNRFTNSGDLNTAYLNSALDMMQGGK